MKSKRDRATTAGIVLFVVLSFLGSWFVAATLRVLALSVHPAPLGTRLFATSLLYAVTMGWQPLVAAWVVIRWVDPPDRLDLGLRPCARIFSLVGCLAALGFAAAATALAWGAVAAGVARSATFNGDAERELVAGAASPGGLSSLILAFLGTVVLVWIQALSEEVAWRGYFLPRVMQRLGRWSGLVLHGTVWGIWYAPVLFFASYGTLSPFGSAVRSLGFVPSCILLGTLLGWLRLASKSLVPAIIANTTLTLVAGLPYVVHGVDAGLRSAIFGPPGWLVLLATILALAASRWRAVVQTPAVEPAPGAPMPPSIPFTVLFRRERRPGDGRTLH